MSESNAADSSEWDDDALRTFLKYLLNHTVAICGTYRYTTGTQDPERAYAYSGCVVASASHWHILTAGHAIQGHLANCESPSIQITCRVLADCFGAAANHRHPIPFDPTDRVLHSVYVEGGLDYAVFTLTDNEKALINANGIQTFAFRDKPLSVHDFDRYLVVGFPDEITDAILGQSQAGVGLQPVCVPLVPVIDSPNANGRMVFRIVEKGTLKSIVGLSGGPVFGLRQCDGQVLVYLLAIQSSWNEVDTTFACTIEDIFNDLREHLKTAANNAVNPSGGSGGS
jgi:hypothetical protein